MSNNLKNEPAMVVALLQAALTVAVSFGLDLSTEQMSALAALAAAAGALLVRQRVTPTSTVDELTAKVGEDAHAASSGGR